MFDKILVAVDVSEDSKYVFESALDLAKAKQASLMLLHVLSLEEENCPEIDGFASSDYYSGLHEAAVIRYRHQWDEFEKQSLEYLRSLANQANAEGIPTEFTQTPGSIGAMVCKLASNWGANLIVVGRRGRSGLSELLLGSVSNYVMHRAPCSVLIINRPGAVVAQIEPEVPVEIAS